jgi:TolB protein
VILSQKKSKDCLLAKELYVKRVIQQVMIIGLMLAVVCCIGGNAQTEVTQPDARQGVAAEARGLTVTGKAGTDNMLKVAVAELQLSGAEDSDLRVQYWKTMQYDLDFSDFFKVLPNSVELVSQHQKDLQVRAIDYGAWQRLDSDVLVKGEFAITGNRGQIRLYAYDVFDELSLAALEYTVDFDSPERRQRELRRAVHNFVDTLVQKYDPAKMPGCAHTYIAVENEQAAADRGGNKKNIREIFIMDYDGRNIRQITRDRDLALSPAWSPDGRKLVYTSYRQSNPDLYIYDLDSGKINVLAAFPGLNGAASWNPSGSALAMTLSRDGNPEIYRIDASGSNPRRLTRNKTVETSSTWTPDGQTIVFVSDAYGSPQIVAMSADGGQMRTLTRTGHNDDPSVSPRGDRIAYTSSRGGGGFNIWICDMNGGNNMNLTSDLAGSSEHPTWAPDGRHITFANSGIIYVMDGNGSDKRAITSAERLRGKNFSPAWGP